MATPRFLLRKKKPKHRHSIRRGFVLWCFCHWLFLIGNFVMVASPRFPKYSGIDPKKALKKMGIPRKSLALSPRRLRILYIGETLPRAYPTPDSWEFRSRVSKMGGKKKGVGICTKIVTKCSGLDVRWTCAGRKHGAAKTVPTLCNSWYWWCACDEAGVAGCCGQRNYESNQVSLRWLEVSAFVAGFYSFFCYRCTR